MEEKFNKRLLSKDLQKQNPLKKLWTISLYYYWKFIKSHPIELKQALDDILPSNYLSWYEEYFRNQKEEKSNKTSKSKKSNRKHSKDNKDKLFDNELFYNEDEEIKLTFDRAWTLKRWTDLAALFSETVEQLKHGKRKVNLKKYNTFKRSSWIKLFIKNERTAYAKNKQAKAPVEHKPYDDMNILKSDLEFLEEFLDVSNEDDDESNEEKALLSSTLNKSDNAYSGSSDQLADNADTYVFLVELLNECIEWEMPDDFEIIKKIKTGIDHFENFHKEYRSFFNYQRDVVKFSKNLIPIKSSQPYFSTESVQKLVDKGKSKKHIIPLNNEISDLEFYLMQYEEFKHEYMNECLDIVSSLTKETSFADDPKWDRASFIFNQVKFLPLLWEADEELLTKIWCISWMKKVDELINDIRKRSLSEWTQLADEISTIECDSVLSGYPSYEDFKTNYSCGYDIYNILYNKKTKAYKIYPNELGHIIEVWNNCKIYLEEEIEQLTHEVEKFKKTDALLIEMINNREFLSKDNYGNIIFL